MKSRLLASCFIVALGFVLMACTAYADIDPATIVGAWLFDEGRGDLAEDASKGGHNGKLEKNPTWVDGRFGEALEFNGGNYVELEDAAPDLHFGGVEPFTVSAWVNPNPGGTVIGKFNGGVIGAYILVVQGSVTFHREVAPWGLNSTKNVPQGDFSHVAATYDGEEMRIYIDGDPAGEQPRGAQNTDAVTPVLIGARFTGGAPSNFFTGVIDEVILFNVALSEADVQTVMRGAAPFLGLAVNPKGKLTTAWAAVKREH